MKKVLKGFTLIELLIVIAIIGILAVAFLPTLLGSPAKGRDSARIADMQKIQKVLVSQSLPAGNYPATNAGASLFAQWGLINDLLLADVLDEFGGVAPQDPRFSSTLDFSVANNRFNAYWYRKDYPYGGVTYSFALIAFLEGSDGANAVCTRALGANAIVAGSLGLKLTPSIAAEKYCYVVLSK